MDKNNQPIRILFAEDLPADAEMARREIKKGGIDFTYRVVDTEAEFREELNAFAPDIVVSDYSMPTFDGMEALKITRSFSRHIPFIILTGSMNEETAVACMKAGANDYVIKEQIKRLPFAVLEAIGKNRSRIEKEKMKIQLRESGEMYRSLIENSSDAIYLLYNRRFEIINSEFTRMFGYNKEEVNQPGFDFVQIVAPESRPFIEERLAKVNRGEEVNNRYEFTAIAKNGDKKEVETSVSYIHLKGELAIQGIIRDITARKQAEEQLKLLGRAVEQNPIAIEITDPEGNIEYANPAFSQITGYTFEEVKGRNPRFLQSGHHSREFYKKLWDTILAGKEWQGEFRNRKKNGDLYWEEAIISPIHDEQGNIKHFVGVKEDITEKKKTFEDLKIAKEHAEESDRLKSAFLANMSHEIRTPMNGILGFADLLKEPRLTGDERIQYVNIIQKSGERMLNTINDLIDISKIETGIVEVDYSEVNLNELIGYFYSFFKPEAEKKGLQFSWNKTLPDEDAWVKTDKEKLSAILSNLIKNAIKYTNKGRIDFESRLSNGIIEFCISDTGIGIEKDRQEAVFNRFVQADTSLTKPYEGAGLGLAISKAYVEMLGGKMWLKSEPDKGSQFLFTIPCSEKEEKEAKEYEPVAVRESVDEVFKKLTILVAEDDEVTRVYLSELLEEKCMRILFATNGKEAVELYHSNPNIDLVLMDIKMPVMDGYTATIKIKDIDENALVIAQTAYALSGDREKALAAGCEDYLSKPLKEKDLLNIIGNKFIS